MEWGMFWLGLGIAIAGLCLGSAIETIGYHFEKGMRNFDREEGEADNDN